MTTQFKALLRKEWLAKLSPFKKEKRDVFSIIINIILTLAVCAVLIVVFGYLAKTYVNVKIGFDSAVIQREKELLTMVFAVIILINIIVGTTKINRSISDHASWQSLLSLPIKASDIYKTKLIFIYLDLLFLTMVTLLPLLITFCIVANGSFLFVMSGIGLSLVIPIISLMFCSLLALPIYYLKKALSKNYVVTAILFCLLLVGFFYLYSLILGVLKSLLETGDIKFIFNEDNITFITTLTNGLFPSNILASVMIFQNVWLNLLWVILISVFSFAVTFIATKYIFVKASKNNLLKFKEYSKEKVSYKKKSQIFALIHKEYISVLRTPSFSFQYFATSIALPLMVFVTCSLVTSLVNKLIFIDCNFEIAIITMAMFSILTNTFCATNISREKRYFNLTKTLPVDYRKIVFAKIIFCGVSSGISLLISGIALLIGGYINILQCLLAIIITALLSLGVICFATRKDLNHPDFDNANGGTAVSFVIFFGLLISAGVAVLALLSSLYIKTMVVDIALGEVVSVGIMFVFALVIFAISLVYLLKGLGKKYSKVVA